MKKCKVNEIKLFDAKCNLPSLKDDINDLCLLHSENPNKELKKFKHKIIKKLEDKDYDFSAIYFPSAIDFPIDFNFSRKTSFSNATFIDRAGFFRSIFSEEVDFSEIEFYGTAIFLSAKFLKGANFSSTLFQKEARFMHSRFSGEIIFFDVDFQEKANFWGAILTDSADITFAKVLTLKDSSEQSFYGDFSRLEIHSGALLKFENISLSNVIFKHTDLRKIRFIM